MKWKEFHLSLISNVSITGAGGGEEDAIFIVFFY
jgi:hypothetical protein